MKYKVLKPIYKDGKTTSVGTVIEVPKNSVDALLKAKAIEEIKDVKK